MWKAIVGVSVMLGAGNALASSAPSTLPPMTVYPSPTELLLDRIAREIVAELPITARLPELAAARSGAEAVTTVSEAESESS